MCAENLAGCYGVPALTHLGTPSTDRMIRVRAYQFEYGVLYLREALATTLSLKEVTEQFGSGKGALIDGWDDKMSDKYINGLESFTEQ